MDKPEKHPTLFMLAGPNGSGKTSFYDTVIKPRINSPFINADLIQRDELDDPSMEAAYNAARIAQERREQFIAARQSFISESTFSHPSKLQLIEEAQIAGFRIVLYHINVRDPKLSVSRVACRVEEGGHNVPVNKIVERYYRSPLLIKRAVLNADHGFVYDNSALNRPPALAISFHNGRINRISASVPGWVRKLYKHQLQAFVRSTKTR
jgi:predicted ABC-type ATPase